jgi:hypothetical protein
MLPKAEEICNQKYAPENHKEFFSTLAKQRKHFVSELKAKRRSPVTFGVKLVKTNKKPKINYLQSQQKSKIIKELMLK